MNQFALAVASLSYVRWSRSGHVELWGYAYEP